MKNFEELLKTIDVEYIKENPETILGLIEALVHELSARKEMIETLKYKLLAGAALLEGMQKEESDGLIRPEEKGFLEYPYKDKMKELGL